MSGVLCYRNHPQSVERLDELEESVCSVMLQKNKREYQGDSGKTSTGVRGRDMAIEKGTGKEMGGHRNENVTMDVCGVMKLDKIRTESIRGTTKVNSQRKTMKGD